MKAKQNNNLSRLIFAALFSAIIAVFAQIAIPIPAVPMTLQVFGICLCGYILGTRLSLLSVLVYILMGLIGLPVFCNFHGGAHHIVDFHGGFIIGFLPLAFFCGIALKQKSNLIKILFGIFGVLICHAMGVIQFYIVSENSLLASFLIASMPFLLKDILLCIAAFYIAKYIKKHLIKI